MQSNAGTVLKKCIPSILILMICGSSGALAGDFTIGLKAWNASMSSENFIDDDAIFFPGVYFSWDINHQLWISSGYIEGEVDAEFPGNDLGETLEEMDFDIIVGWNVSKKFDVGIGYRVAEFTTTVFGQALPVTSEGPMAYLGGGGLFGQSQTGYYWGVAYMFEDLEDEDGSQTHINSEVGLRWIAQNNLAMMVGYRYKEYSGGGVGGLTFQGPVVNLSFTWR